MSTLKISKRKATENPNRIPNAFMIFVQERSTDLASVCPEEEKAKLGIFLGKKWRSMSIEEKQVYFDKFKALKKRQKEECDLNTKEEKNENRNIGNSSEDMPKNKSTASETFSAEQNFNKVANQLTSIDDLTVTSLAKQKKIRRPLNAFFLFCKEQRPTVKKDKNFHASVTLGNMWRELPYSDKAKYRLEAKRLQTLHKKSVAASEKIPKRTKKVRSATVTKKSIMQYRRKIKKSISFDVSSNLIKQESDDIEKTEIVSNSRNSSDKIESPRSTNPSSEHHVHNEYPNLTCVYQPNCSMNNLHHMPSASTVEPLLSNSCCCQSASSSHGCANLKQSSTCIAGMPDPYFGSPFFPPAISSYPFNTSPWMYPQPMAPHWFPFSSPTFYPSPYSYSLPYSRDNSYIGYHHSSQYGVYGPSTCGTSNPTTAATATDSCHKEEYAETKEKNGISEEEELIVDDDPDEKQETK